MSSSLRLSRSKTSTLSLSDFNPTKTYSQKSIDNISTLSKSKLLGPWTHHKTIAQNICLHTSSTNFLMVLLSLPTQWSGKIRFSGSTNMSSWQGWWILYNWRKKSDRPAWNSSSMTEINSTIISSKKTSNFLILPKPSPNKWKSKTLSKKTPKRRVLRVKSNHKRKRLKNKPKRTPKRRMVKLLTPFFPSLSKLKATITVLQYFH